jgi:hypothetical protein
MVNETYSGIDNSFSVVSPNKRQPAIELQFSELETAALLNISFFVYYTSSCSSQ